MVGVERSSFCEVQQTRYSASAAEPGATDQIKMSFQLERINSLKPCILCASSPPHLFFQFLYKQPNPSTSSDAQLTHTRTHTLFLPLLFVSFKSFSRHDNRDTPAASFNKWAEEMGGDHFSCKIPIEDLPPPVRLICNYPLLRNTFIVEDFSVELTSWDIDSSC